MNKSIKTALAYFGIFLFLVLPASAQQRSCGVWNPTNNGQPTQQRLHQDRVVQYEQYRERVSRTARLPCTNPIKLPIAIHFQRINNPDIACLRALCQGQIDILNADIQAISADTVLWQNNAVNYPSVLQGKTCLTFVIANSNHPAGYNLEEGDPAITINSTRGDNFSDWAGYINVVVRDLGGDLGYAPLGGLGNGDGLNVDERAFGTFGCGQVLPHVPYNLGRTLVHEMGHYLFLNHIWANSADVGGCTNDDGLADTPMAAAPNYGCPNSNISCGSLDLSMNYMDYVNDACMYMFSDGQARRMEDWVSANLQNVVNNTAQVYQTNTCDSCTSPNCTDTDQDGYCQADDCDDNNPNIPAASGSSCNDDNPNTRNDIIQLDGCTCLGINVLCSQQGGDTDGDGICDELDCDPADACYPMPFGTACDDGDSNTSDDSIQADGCTCAGIQTTGLATTVHAKIYLEGLYESSTQRLNTDLKEQSLLPNTQPYNVAPWFYAGNESTAVIPDKAVDWILIMARDANDNILTRTVGFISESGGLIDLNGNQGISLGQAAGNYISIHHRNHLAVVSTIPYNTSLDFTSTESAVKGVQQLKNMAGKFCLYSGDFDGNGIINSLDYNSWALNKSALNQYLNIDADGNGIINNLDYNLWLGNRAKIGHSGLHY